MESLTRCPASSVRYPIARQVCSADDALENCLIQTPMLGDLRRPLSALVFHSSQYTSQLSFRPCEAAFLGCPNRQFPTHPSVAPVNILVAPSNYHNLQVSYAQIPGVNVQPFRLRPRDLNVSSMLTLMSVDQSQSAPLYIGQITKILREMASTSSQTFNYAEFKRRLEGSKLSGAQRGPLQQRLELLESFLILDDSIPSWNFECVSATVIDLSCPFWIAVAKEFPSTYGPATAHWIDRHENSNVPPYGWNPKIFSSSVKEEGPLATHCRKNPREELRGEEFH